MNISTQNTHTFRTSAKPSKEAGRSEQALWRTFTEIRGIIHAEIELALSACASGLSPVEFTVLDAVCESAGERMRMQRIAERGGLSPSATTRLVSRLELRGLLSRVLCGEDARGIVAVLTSEGRTLREKVKPHYDRAITDALDKAAVVPHLTSTVDALRGSAAALPR